MSSPYLFIKQGCKKMTILPEKKSSTITGHNRHHPDSELLSHVHQEELQTPEHYVQFYEKDASLLNSLYTYISEGLTKRDACIVIATKEHREELEQRLQGAGLNLTTARIKGLYISLDAAATLAQFMDGYRPDKKCFTQVVEPLIIQAARCSSRPIRLYGEMVALLWSEGKREAALHLEDLWNDLRLKSPPFTLFCAYSMQSFGKESYQQAFREICEQHSRVIPSESFSELNSDTDRLRTIALLQQKADALEAEVAERKVVEEALRASEARFRIMAEAMPKKIFTSTPKGAYDYFNLQWMEFTGATFDDLRDWGWTQYLHPEDAQQVLSEWKRVLKTGEHFDFEVRLRRADDVYRWHICRAAPVRNDAQKITMWIGSYTDINEQKQLEERKNAFISIASHELKTPITSLKGFTQILQRRLQAIADPQTLLFLDRMDAQLKRLNNLINDLLDVSKMQTGILAFRENAIDLDTLVHETVENIQATTTHQLVLEGATHVQVYGDWDRLGQVLINLLTNAVKYSPQADRVLIHLSSDKQQAKISVQDFGIGIAGEHHERIFDRFYQVGDPQGKSYPGLGIGLHIARTIVERHGGRLWLESKRGAGSTFYLTLPRLQQ
jgi:PAS domain S-box-containing protein